MNILVNFADEKYRKVRSVNSWTGSYIAGMDVVKEYDLNDIDSEFKKKYTNIFSFQRGCGLWLWKPYLVNKVIKESNDGDYIFYCDSGSFFIRNPKVLYKYLTDEQPLFVCDIPLLESCFTKPECFNIMECETENIKFSNQIIATYFIVKVCDKSRRFVKEWLDYCCQEKLLSPAGLKKNETPTHYMGSNFVSHREDQSIFSLLCKKYKIQPHKDISQRGHDPESYRSPFYVYKEPVHNNDLYKPMIFLHKTQKLNLRWWIIYIYKRLRRFLSQKTI